MQTEDGAPAPDPQPDPQAVAEALEVLAAEALSPAGQAALATLRALLPVAGALTPRQREVAALLARGFSNRAIAAVLGMKEGTARLHVSAVLGRLGVNSREAVAARLKQG